MSGDLIDRLRPFVPASVRGALNRTLRYPARRVARRARAPLERGLREPVGARAGGAPILSITAIAPEDVVVVGFPKSGNTWFQYLAAGAIHGVDTTLAPFTLVSHLVPDVHRRRYYRRFGTPMFFKSHRLPRPEYRRVVYLMRDGRDVMVSYLHHLRAVGGADDGVDLLTLVETGRGLQPCRWHEHVEAWLSNPFGADMITVRYEDLLADGVGELRRLCEFVGVDRDPSFLATVVDRAAFDTLRDRERSTAAHNNPRWPKDVPFFRRGEAGSYRDEMSQEALAAFMAQAGPTLREQGYPPA
jgi:hypothetical protein